MASIFKFSGYMVAPNDEFDAKEFMDGLIEFAEMNDMYEGPLVTEARRFEWDDDLLINDTECPDEVFEMYFDGTIKTYDDLESNNEEDIDCDTCELKDECTSINKSEQEDFNDEEVTTVFITVFDDIDDEEEKVNIDSSKADTENEKADIDVDFDRDDVTLLKALLKNFHKNNTVSDALGIACLLDKLIVD